MHKADFNFKDRLSCNYTKTTRFYQVCSEENSHVIFWRSLSPDKAVFRESFEIILECVPMKYDVFSLFIIFKYCWRLQIVEMTCSRDVTCPPMTSVLTFESNFVTFLMKLFFFFTFYRIPRMKGCHLRPSKSHLKLDSWMISNFIAPVTCN